MENNVIDLKKGRLTVKLIKLSVGYIRIGTFPSISKELKKIGIIPVVNVLAPFRAGLYGDTRTGEEFVFWDTIFSQKQKLKYIAPVDILENFYDVMGLTVPWDFDEKKIRIVRRSRLEEFYQPYPVAWNAEGVFENIILYYSEEGIEIRDGSDTYFTAWNELIDIRDKPAEEIKFDNNNKMAVYVGGSGNGFCERTSNFIIKAGETILWVDPPGDIWDNKIVPINKLTGIIITHNHEDHMAGFPIIIYMAQKQKIKLNVYTSKKIWEVLQKQFSYMQQDINENVIFNDISPELGEKEIVNIRVKTRWNHHCLPTGTLGLKFYYKNECIAISGDTKYSNKIISILEDENLGYKWFEDAGLVFHEAAKRTEHSVHTDFEDLIDLKKYLQGNLLYYHNCDTYEGLEKAEEGKIYYI